MRATTVPGSLRPAADALVQVCASTAPQNPPLAGTTRKRGNKWGSAVPTVPSALPMMGRPLTLQMVAVEAAAAAAAGQVAINAHAQQRAEAIAKLQVLTGRGGVALSPR